jgi:WD40 repeat protein
MADGRVVTGGADRRVLIWDPASPGTDPAELGRHGGPIRAVAVLPHGRVVTGGLDQRILVWDPADPQVLQLSCPVIALNTAPSGLTWCDLVIAHEGSGWSLWSLRDDHERERAL